MSTRSKITLSCARAALLLLAGAITAFVMFANSLASDPIKGWQEGPHTPNPPPTISYSPEPTATPSDHDGEQCGRRPHVPGLRGTAARRMVLASAR